MKIFQLRKSFVDITCNDLTFNSKDTCFYTRLFSRLYINEKSHGLFFESLDRRYDLYRGAANEDRCRKKSFLAEVIDPAQASSWLLE